MVSSETLQIIIDAKDLLSNKVNGVKSALRGTATTAQQANQQAANSANQVGTAYDRVKAKVTNAMNGVRNAIKSATTGQVVNESSLSQPFMNAAEKIKSKYLNMTTIVKGKLKELTAGNQVITIKGDNGDILKKITVTKAELIKIGQMNADPFKNISTAGLKTLNAEIGQATMKAAQFNGTAIQVGNTTKTVTTTMGTLGTMGAAAVAKLQGGFQRLHGSLTTVKGKISNLLSGISGMQSVIMGAFGAVGVTSMKSFIIEAGLAREKVNAVTKSIVGSGEAFKRMDSAIKTAVAGTTLGYNNVAKAVNNVGLRYKMTADQLEKVPGVMSKVGLMAQAMGKSNEEAAKMMEAAYDGLMGKWRSLKTLGITKEDLMAAGWSGAASDVNGYSDALEKVLSKNPKLKEMMNTTEYKMESLKMAIKGVGTEIGVALLPYIKGLLTFLLDLKKNNPALFKLIVIVGVIIAVVSSLAMVLLPIVMLVSAIGATVAGVIILIAALAAGVYLAYTHFQQVRDVMKPVIDAFNDLGKAFQDLMNGKISIWDFLGKLLWALAQIPTIIPRVIAGLLMVVWDWLVGELSKIGSNIGSWIMGLINDVGSWLSNGASSITAWISQGFMGFVNSIIEGFSNMSEQASTGFNSFIAGVSAWLGSLWEGLVLWGQQLWTNISTWFTTTLPLILQQVGVLFMNILTGVGTFFMSLIMGLASWQSSVLIMVVNFLLGLYNNFITWAINIVNGFILWISTLPGRFYTWLMNTYQKAVAWATQTINKFKTAAQQAVNGFIQWISTLPGKFWTWLMNTLAKIASFASQCLTKMRNAAKSAVDGFINKFKELPGKVWDELMRVGDKILSAGGTLAQKAYDLGKRIVDSLLSPFDFGSPGIVSRSVGQEMVYMREFLEDAVRPLTKRASIVGSSVVDSLQNSLSFEKLNLTDSFENDIITEVAGNVNGDVTFHSSTEDKQLSTLLDVKALLSDLITLLLSGEVVTGNGNTAVIVNSLENANTSDILGVLRDHISDRDIIRQIASSPDFQELDNRNKNQILNRLNRHL